MRRHGHLKQPHPRHHGPACLTTAILATIIAGCGSSTPRGVHAGLQHLPPSRAPKPLRAPGARIQITTPKTGQREPTAFTAHVAITGFRLTRPSAGSSARQGSGHLHFSLDHGRYDQPRYSGPNGEQALTTGVNGFYSPAYQPTITYKHIPPGRHTLQAELVNRDETPTGVSETVHFTVR